MKNILIGIVIGWFLSFIYGWNRRSAAEYRKFKRGFELGRRYPKKGI